MKVLCRAIAGTFTASAGITQVTRSVRFWETDDHTDAFVLQYCNWRIFYPFDENSQIEYFFFSVIKVMKMMMMMMKMRKAIRSTISWITHPLGPFWSKGSWRPFSTRQSCKKTGIFCRQRQIEFANIANTCVYRYNKYPIANTSSKNIISGTSNV